MSTNFPTDNPTWDLDPIFEGGVESTAFSEEVDALKESIQKLGEELEDLALPASGDVDDEQLDAWREFFDHYFSVRDRSSEAGSFSRALAATHTDEPEAIRMPSLLDDVDSGLDGIGVDIEAKFRGLSDEVFEALHGDRRFADMDLWLRELRRDADRAMDRELEQLAVQLNRDGVHAWSRLYSEVSGRLEVEVELEDETKRRSVGQAFNLLSNPRRSTRQAAFDGLQEAWDEAAPVCASALNSIRGTQRTLFERRGGDCLTMPLDANRVQRQTIEAMFEAAAEFQPLLVRYLKAKARLLGVDALQWYDLRAPVGGEEAEQEISYQQAQKFIVEQVDQFSPKIADFCRNALARRWVEAEDRGGKRQGGYCTSLPVSKQIRIFMTYGGTSSGVSTLAHELGHGYHFEVIKDQARSEQRVPMGLAETASTLLEAIVEQASLETATGGQELKILDERLGRGVVFLMNIPARFELEKKMHQHRANGTLHQELLSEMTRECFEKSYGDGVGSVDELYWAAKSHFFMSGLPFYNFPYTFGYLFSRAVYRRARRESGFIDGLDDLLRDTGRMTSEKVAQKYLGADIGDPKFWTEAATGLVDDVERYEKMVDEAL